MPNLEYLRSIYQTLHQYPELSEQEFRTADLLAKELAELGFTVRKNVGGTGVVGILACDAPGRTVALRADMDGLPVQEETGVDYASKNPGVMHACGHDSHMATVLGVCRYAAQHRHELTGTVMAVFQPAEEVVVGARAMLEGGLFAELKPDRIVGIHNWPSLPAGSIGLQAGPITAFADRFKVTFQGVGGHGAVPHKTADPIAMAAAGVQNAFALAQRCTDSTFPQTLSFGLIQGGTRFNVIPSEVVAEGTVRTTRLTDQARMIENLHRAFETSAKLYGGNYSLEYSKGVPAVVNDQACVEELSRFFAAEISEVPVATLGLASLIGEDFAYYLAEVKGALLLVGSGREGGTNELHHPGFLVPPKTLATGYKALVSILRGYLA
ncbi:MAG: amidohydrolase [Firmicutes bacterium]|nr:amidohydrolase [Bacillota bacterium]